MIITLRLYLSCIFSRSLNSNLKAILEADPLRSYQREFWLNNDNFMKIVFNLYIFEIAEFRFKGRFLIRPNEVPLKRFHRLNNYHYFEIAFPL